MKCLPHTSQVDDNRVKASSLADCSVIISFMPNQMGRNNTKNNTRSYRVTKRHTKQLIFKMHK